MRKLILLVGLIIGTFSLQAQYAGFNALADVNKFKEQFALAAQKTNSIQSDFVQEKNLSMLSDKIVSKGRFWFKKNNMVRMEYSQPSKYLLILNKDQVYIKDGAKESKLSTRSNKMFQQVNRVIVDCVQGAVLNNPDFKSKVFESKLAYLVELTPIAKGMKDLFKTIQVTLDKKDYSVATIKMEENSGDDTVMKFSNKVLNTSIADALFTIK